MSNPDPIRELIIQRAQFLSKTAYGIARDSGLSPDHVKNYLMRRSSMTTERLQHVFKVLGLEIKPKE